VIEWCREQALDGAFVPPGRRFADLRLLALDMDSTLITIECIDAIGDLAGRGPLQATAGRFCVSGALVMTTPPTIAV
jgi:phosphoserine phosphatase